MAGGQLEIWWAGPADANWRQVALLDDAERMRLARFAQEADRSRYLVAHALTRLALGAALGIAPDKMRFDRECRRCGRDHGKPRVLGSEPMEFSMSHSGDRVALAVGAADAVGVDVEQVNRRLDADELAPVILSAPERDWLRDQPAGSRRRGLLSYWTRKEAIVKATGHGLSVPPATLSVTAPDSEPRLVSWTGPEAPEAPVWLADLDPDRDHVGCVAALVPTPLPVVERDASALLAG